MNWCRIDTALPDDPRTHHLAEILRRSHAEAVGIVTLLTLYAGRIETGDFGQITASRLVAAAHLPGPAARVVGALIEAGFLSREAGGSLVAVGFTENHAGMLRGREAARERAARHREAAKAKGNAATVTPHGTAHGAPHGTAHGAMTPTYLPTNQPKQHPPRALARAHSPRPTEADSMKRAGGNHGWSEGKGTEPPPSPAMAAALLKTATERRAGLAAALAAHESGARSLAPQTEQALRAEIDRLDARIGELTAAAAGGAP